MEIPRDLIPDILSYISFLPQKAHVSSIFQKASEYNLSLLEQKMDMEYPFWDIEYRDLSEEYLILTHLQPIIIFHMNRAAIKGDWESFKRMVYHSKDSSDILCAAMDIAHVSHKDGLGNLIYNIYKDNIEAATDAVRYYAALNEQDMQKKIKITKYLNKAGYTPSDIQKYIKETQVPANIHELNYKKKYMYSILTGIDMYGFCDHEKYSKLPQEYYVSMQVSEDESINIFQAIISLCVQTLDTIRKIREIVSTHRNSLLIYLCSTNPILTFELRDFWPEGYQKKLANNIRNPVHQLIGSMFDTTALNKLKQGFVYEEHHIDID